MTFTSFAQKAHSILESKKFFYTVVALLVVQALWAALTARYPMAFDENFHFGIIQIYADQWSPFITSTPPDSGEYGQLIRTPSYLYHYLMSFPLRFIELFTDQQMWQVIFLRLINIALFAAGLAAFRKLLLQFKFSTSITHFSLLMLILVPVVPFLAGQINYDNLLFLLVPLLLIFAHNCGRQIAQKGTLPVVSFILFAITGMVSSLVKFAFAPLFFAAALYLAIVLWQNKPKNLAKKAWQSFAALRPLTRWLLIGGVLLSGGLFAERYGVNTIEYGKPDPDCAAVESIEHCKEWGPWGRNYQLTQVVQASDGSLPLDPHPAVFPFAWVGGMMHRLYFAINYDYTNYYELPIPTATAYIVGVTGFVLICVFWRKLFNGNKHLLLFVLIAAIYTAALLYVNVTDYLEYRVMSAINGRYLIPILPLLFAVMASAYALWINKAKGQKKRRNIKVGLVTAVLILTLQGGGILTHAVRSDAGWHWQTPAAQALGNGLRQIVSPFIIGSNWRVKG